MLSAKLNGGCKPADRCNASLPALTLWETLHRCATSLLTTINRSHARHFRPRELCLGCKGVSHRVPLENRKKGKDMEIVGDATFAPLVFAGTEMTMETEMSRIQPINLCHADCASIVQVKSMLFTARYSRLPPADGSCSPGSPGVLRCDPRHRRNSSLGFGRLRKNCRERCRPRRSATP